MEHCGSARWAVAGHPWSMTSRSEMAQGSSWSCSGQAAESQQEGNQQGRFAAAASSRSRGSSRPTTSLSSCSGASCAFTDGSGRIGRRPQSQGQGWRTAIGATSGGFPAAHTTDGSKMQKLVTELNQIAAERHALSQATEPCTKVQVVGRRWSTREKLRSAGCPRVWICGRHLAGVEHAGTRSIENGDIEQGFRTRDAGAVHGRPDLSWDSHVCCDRCSRRQAEVSRRGRPLSSPSTLKTRCRRCEAQHGLRGVRMGFLQSRTGLSRTGLSRS